MADTPLLELIGINKSFGGLRATDDVSFALPDKHIMALIGPNGAGKSTLIAQISGELRSDSGRMMFQGRDISALPGHRRAHRGLARSFQITSVFPQFTVLQNVLLVSQGTGGHCFQLFRPATSNKRAVDVSMAHLETVGLGDRAHTLVSDLNYGAQRQLELAMALALSPKLLLLDEPMAGLGPQETKSMIEILRKIKGTVGMLLVEHDMEAVFALADSLAVLVYGRVIATGEPEAIKNNVEVQRAYLGSEAH